MCGRFVAATPPDQLARYFGAESLIEPSPGDTTGSGANYNVAPTQRVHTVYEDARGRCLTGFHWGLVPFWAKDPRIGAKMAARCADSPTRSSTCEWTAVRGRRPPRS